MYFKLFLDLEEELERTKEELIKCRKDLQTREANRFTFQTFIESMKRDIQSGEKPACPTCSRGFKNKPEAESLIEDLQEEIDKIPSKVKSLKDRVEKNETKVETLQLMLPKKQQLKEIQLEMKEKGAAIQTLDRDVKKIQRNVELNEQSLEEVGQKVDLCDELREDVFNMDRLNREVKDLKKCIKELTSENQDIQVFLYIN